VSSVMPAAISLHVANSRPQCRLAALLFLLTRSVTAMASPSQLVPCSPNFVETVKYNSPVASVPDGDSSPFMGTAGKTLYPVELGLHFCRTSWRQL